MTKYNRPNITVIRYSLANQAICKPDTSSIIEVEGIDWGSGIGNGISNGISKGDNNSLK